MNKKSGVKSKGGKPISPNAKATEMEHKTQNLQRQVNSKSGVVPGGRKSEKKIPGKRS